jgi:tellurite resistance protein TerC
MTLWWIVFGVLIITMLALDLGVFNRKVHIIKMKEALLWTAFWVLLASLFCAGIYSFYGHSKAMEFSAAYLLMNIRPCSGEYCWRSLHARSSFSRASR